MVGVVVDVALDPEAVLVRELKRHRVRLDITAQELSNRIGRAGGKLTRQAVSNIERGVRGVSIPELMMLAKALDVPPLLLICPVAQVETIEIIPGLPTDTWQAAKWVTGEAGFPGEPGGPVSTRLPLDLYREHDRHLAEYRTAKDQATLASLGADPNTPEWMSDPHQEAIKTFERTAYDAEMALSAVRSEMRRHGVLPPAITDIRLSHIDGGGE
jgi:transcriptional regulator with XRE-family HTH domain